jgi:halimadienyl-diphosphate synthase
MINIEVEIQNLLKEIGPGRMSSTTYDTAWVARLGEIDRDLSNHAMEWLCDNQLSDGSWGAKDIFYYHDRVICTLAAMIALTQRGRRAHDKKQIENGLLALERMTSGATQGLASDPNGATIGFELIAPTLVKEAEKLGIIKQQGERILGRLGKLRKTKLDKMAGYKISRNVTMAFSAEMAGVDGQQILDVPNLPEVNHSIGHSPSASAYYIKNVDPNNTSVLEYLRNTMHKDGGFPDVAPFDSFEISWSLWNLKLSSMLNDADVKPFVNILSDAWQDKVGIGFGTQYSVKDSDVTSFVFDTLSRFGVRKDVESMLAYEEDKYFRCYPLEANPSISANIHVLGALRQAGFERDHPSVQKILNFLKVSKNGNPYWVDKWHSSPYYTTSHAVIACAGYADDLVAESVQWLLYSQHANGSWGTYLPTAEETAYAMQALWFWNENSGKIDLSHLNSGRNWLEEHMDKPYPPLWIGKCLYSPTLVVRSAVIGAMAFMSI